MAVGRVNYTARAGWAMRSMRFKRAHRGLTAGSQSIYIWLALYMSSVTVTLKNRYRYHSNECNIPERFCVIVNAFYLSCLEQAIVSRAPST